MNTDIKHCTCNTCIGAACTCGCQGPTTMPAGACQCGCQSGQPCQCGPRVSERSVRA